MKRNTQVKPTSASSVEPSGRKQPRPSPSAARVGTKRSAPAQLLGRYIVADPKICHGKPTFRGTRIFVSDVLEMVAEGMAWEAIVEEWNGNITNEAISEAVNLARQTFLEHAPEYLVEPTAA
jgi:uncharacterized protein (DUF433 family)